jgi:hypothetical protein
VAITKNVDENLMIRQSDPDSNAVLIPQGSIKLSQLSTEIRFGLIPIGAIIPIFPHMSGSYQPGASGVVEGGYIRCDGAGIPAPTPENGIIVTGTTPNITGSIYLKGATASTGADLSSNSRVLNTPQLPLHSHPVTLGYTNIPHTHPTGAMSTTVGTHSHPQTVGTTDMSHSHPSTGVAVNAPHSHPTSQGASNAPHSHSISINSTTANHSHFVSDVSTAASPFHNHYTHGSPRVAGTGMNTDFDAFNPTSSGYPQGATMGSASVPHRHTTPSLGTNSWPHSHPITIWSTVASHSHTANAPTNNIPHGHPVSSIAAANAPHSHTVTVSATNAPHAHPVSIGTQNIPHNHPGSTMGNTGSGDILSFEPQYIDCIYVMRVR